MVHRTFIHIALITLLYSSYAYSAQVAEATQQIFVPVHNDHVYEIERDNLTVHATKVTAKESKKHFGKNLIKYGYQPIIIELYNNSDDVLLWRASSFDKQLQTSGKVYEDTKIPTLQITGYSALLAGIFFWPALIPVAGAGLWMASKNIQVSQAIETQILEGDIAFEILPYEYTRKVIFLQEEILNPNATNKITFHLFNLHQKSFIPCTITFGSTVVS